MRYLQHVAEWFVEWRAHRRQRQELSDFLNSDHRAAADIGLTRYDAQRYISAPFRRASEIDLDSSLRGNERPRFSRRLKTTSAGRRAC
jgi:uncharacterized protein YjiS (DUF1127 family)